MPERHDSHSTHASVIVSLAINGGEALALGIAAWMSGSVSLRAQTADTIAEFAVGVFLFIGVYSSARPSDESHPLGYGRERFFWSLFAALGICVGGAGFSLDAALRSALHPTPVDSYPLSYTVLVVTIVLDFIALAVAWRSLRKEADDHQVSLKNYLLKNTDPALTTVFAGGECAVIGGLAATLGLALRQITGSPIPDTVASGLIGLLLLVTSVFLLQTNRELLTGRGVHPAMLNEMRDILAAQNGIEDIPDLFAVVVGPSSLVVNGDVTFDHGLDVSDIERTIVDSTAALRERWPSIEFVYLTPVHLARPRRVKRPKSSTKNSYKQD